MLHCILLIISVFYFDVKISLYTLALLLVSQFTLFGLHESLVPHDSPTAAHIRITIYGCVGMTAALGAKATREVMKMAILSALEAEESFESLKAVAGNVQKTVAVLKKESESQASVVVDVNNVSQQQAAALEQISAAIEEMSRQFGFDYRDCKSPFLKNADHLHPNQRRICAKPLTRLCRVPMSLAKSIVEIIDSSKACIRA
jgi:hypothetical protein